MLAMAGGTWSSMPHLLAAVVPAQQGQVVDHGPGQEALLPELAHAGGAVPLAELAAVGRQDEAHVAEGRWREAQRAVDENLRTICKRAIIPCAVAMNCFGQGDTLYLHGHDKERRRWDEPVGVCSAGAPPAGQSKEPYQTLSKSAK